MNPLVRRDTYLQHKLRQDEAAVIAYVREADARNAPVYVGDERKTIPCTQ